MDNTIALVSELAWPLTVLILAWGFRQEVRALIGRIKRVSYGDAAVELQELRDEIATEKAKQLPSDTEAPVPSNRFDRRLAELNELVEVSPRAAVMESWIELERSVLTAAERHGIDGSIRSRDMVRRLADRQAIPSDYLSMLDELRRIRNTAAHARSFDFTAPAAADYVNTAVNLAFLIDLVSDTPHKLPTSAPYVPT